MFYQQDAVRNGEKVNQKYLEISIIFKIHSIFHFYNHKLIFLILSKIDPQILTEIVHKPQTTARVQYSQAKRLFIW